jgi:outer membrane lipoprotein SlyB
MRNIEYYFDHTGVLTMLRKITCAGLLAGSFLLAGNAQATELSAVAYGTITVVSQQQKDTSGGKTGGAVVGGLLGLYSGRGRSTSNKILRSGVGAVAGGAVGGAMARGTNMAYTVDLVGGGTVRVVMDSGNFHKGDCVSVERGSTNNMRRVSSEYCSHNKQVPEEYKAEHVKEANECAQAKQELLAAKDEAAVNTAHMKMNILCQD